MSLLEVVVLSAADARAAAAGGADRVELVADMAADGLTPAPRTYAEVREAVDVPVRVMIRRTAGFARGGTHDGRDRLDGHDSLDGGPDELDEPDEPGKPDRPGGRSALAALRSDVEALWALGAREFVAGWLTADGDLDSEACAAVFAELPGCAWTFHRAFDHARDRGRAWQALSGMRGVDTVLTSGGPGGVGAGLAQLAADAAARGTQGPRMLVGGGLRLEHVPPLREAGLDAFHIGTPARRGGWAPPVDAGLVGVWRLAVG